MIGRRQVLGAGAVVAGLAVTGLVTGCSSDDGPSPDATENADEALRRQVGEDEQRLIAAYDATLAQMPDGPLRTTLQTLRDQHAEHAAAVAPDVEPAATSGSTPTVADLQTLERAAAQQRRAACIAASDAELARVLTFVAAAEAAHVPAIAAAVKDNAAGAVPAPAGEAAGV